MILSVQDLKKSFNGNEVLHGISFDVHEGRALGLLGRNGAGKTTTMRIIMDVFRADSGQILLDGKPFIKKDIRIGYLPEERGLYPKKKVIDQMVYLGLLQGLTREESLASSRKWLKRLEIEEYETRLLETLSKGNQQKVQVAATLVASPKLIIFDEPFSGLDPVNSLLLKEVVKEMIDQGTLVIFSSHQMSYVEEFCEDIAIINHGAIVLKGSLQAIKESYGEGRLIIKADDLDQTALSEKLIRDFSDIVTVSGTSGEGLVLNLKKDASVRDYLRRLAESDIPIHQTGNYEPSLNDIFVSVCGNEEEDEHETV